MEPLSSRRSIRYHGYDYSLAGYYALTLCAAHKAPVFGCMANALLTPSPLGLVVREELLQLPQHYPSVRLDEWIIMPNHLHFILTLLKNQTVSVSEVVGGFKSRCYRRWRILQVAQNLPAPPSCWQRNYYERVIRSAEELAGYREYIRENPLRWS